MPVFYFQTVGTQRLKSMTTPSKPQQEGRGHHSGNKISPLLKREVIVEMVTRLADPLCADEGIELVHVEYQREPGGRTLRVYIDKEGGVSLDDCVAISRQLSDILDIKLADQAAYRLEVSSPGIERPLSRKRDFERFKNHMVRIRTVQPLAGRKNFKGRLLGLKHDTVEVLVEGNSVSINFNDIARARLVAEDGES